MEHGAESSPAITDLHLAFTEEVFGGYNRDDAIAAINVWIGKIIQTRNIPVSPVIQVYENSAEFQLVVQTEKADLLGGRVDEYLQVESLTKQEQLFGVVENGRPEVEYLLLTRADNHISSLDDLRGRSIIILDTARSALAPLWLDTVLMRNGLPPAVEWFGRVTQRPKVSKTLLPVFFGKADACVVTRGAFETSSELNPQVGQKLRPIATSVPIVANVVFFRAGYDQELTEDLAKGLLEVHENPQGQQVLLIFGADRIVRLESEDLESVRRLLEEYEQLCAGRPGNDWQPGE